MTKMYIESCTYTENGEELGQGLITSWYGGYMFFRHNEWSTFLTTKSYDKAREKYDIKFTKDISINVPYL